MGNRSRFAAAAAASAAVAVDVVVRARRRARLASATRGIAEEILPSVLDNAPSATLPGPVADDAHAPGHRHLRRSETVVGEPEPGPERASRFAKHRHGRLRHQGWP